MARAPETPKTGTWLVEAPVVGLSLAAVAKEPRSEGEMARGVDGAVYVVGATPASYASGPPEPALHRRSPGGARERRDGMLDVVALRCGVGVAEDERLGTQLVSQPHALVRRGGEAEVGRVGDDADPVDRPGDFRGAVPARVVDDDDLEIAVRLRRERPQAVR